MSKGFRRTIEPPDKSYSAAEAGEELERSGRQVLRYLSSGQLRGSRASGRWTVTALQIWQFQGIAEEMLENWRAYCRQEDDQGDNFQADQKSAQPGE